MLVTKLRNLRILVQWREISFASYQTLPSQRVPLPIVQTELYRRICPWCSQIIWQDSRIIYCRSQNSAARILRVCVSYILVGNGIPHNEKRNPSDTERNNLAEECKNRLLYGGANICSVKGRNLNVQLLHFFSRILYCSTYSRTYYKNSMCV